METATTLKTPTRADYMAGRCSHREFYAGVASTAGVRFDRSHPLVARAAAALAAGDEHLNSIPLATWDRLGATLLGVSRAFKAHGDFDSLAGRVCLLKEVVRQAAERTE